MKIENSVSLSAELGSDVWSVFTSSSALFYPEERLHGGERKTGISNITSEIEYRLQSVEYFNNPGCNCVSSGIYFQD